MTITDILKNNPLVLAPMAGITDLPFRIICREMGAGLVYSEMISAEALIRNNARSAVLLVTDEAEKPVVFQLFGGRTDSMAEAARVLSHYEMDFIDINMGCPVPKVLKSGAGSALLKDINRAREIMTAVKANSRVPVTVKIRIGWDASDFVAVDFAKAAEDAGIAAIAVHGRTKAQGFSGHADWNAIRAVKAAVQIPVIGNGDVRSALDARRMIDQTGCDGVMIGRAIEGNPWIFREASTYLKTGALPPPPTMQERMQVMLRHMNDMAKLIREDIAVREMRKHICWYTKGIPGGAEFREQVNHLDDRAAVEAKIRSYFAAHAHHAFSDTDA